jgi:hypothetical protein
MKIFQIGFNRCGTTSLYNLFRKSGIPSVHWDRGRLAARMKFNYEHNRPILIGYERFRFFSDMETAPHIYGYKYYKLLNQQYPNSKFILNIRDRDNWILSRLRFSKKYFNSHMSHYNLSLPEIINLWCEEWDNHINDVTHYFKGKENLLVFNIEEDNIESVLSFLPKEKLNKKFWWQPLSKKQCNS